MVRKIHSQSKTNKANILILHLTDCADKVIISPQPSPASLVCSFESPFMDPGNPLHPITPPSVRTRPPSLHSRPLSDHPHSQNRPPSLHNQTPLSSLFPLEELRPEDLPPKRSRCRKKRDTGVDKEVSLPEDQPEGEQLPLVFGTRPRNKVLSRLSVVAQVCDAVCVCVCCRCRY